MLDGVTWYTERRAEVTIWFPDGKEKCRFCPYLKSDQNSARYKCVLTDEILITIDNRGHRCPVKEE